jgi:hypothetical protein
MRLRMPPLPAVWVALRRKLPILFHHCLTHCRLPVPPMHRESGMTTKYHWEARIGKAIWKHRRPCGRAPRLRWITGVLLWVWIIVAYGGLFGSAVVTTLLPFKLLAGLRQPCYGLYFIGVSLTFIFLGACSLGLALRCFRWLRKYHIIDVDLSVVVFGFCLALLCCVWIYLSGGTPFKSLS